MWNEISEKAKLHLFKLYMYLAVEKRQLKKLNDSISIQNNDSNQEYPTPEIVFNRWKCINDLYVENGFISIN